MAAVKIPLIKGHDFAVGDDGRRTARNGRIESEYPHDEMKLVRRAGHCEFHNGHGGRPDDRFRATADLLGPQRPAQREEA